MASLDEAFSSNFLDPETNSLRIINKAPEAITIPEDAASTLVKQFKESKEQCTTLQQQLSHASEWISTVFSTWNEVSKKYCDLHSYLQTMPGYLASPDNMDTWATMFIDFKKQGDDILNVAIKDVAAFVEQKTKDLTISKKNLENMCEFFEIMQKETHPALERLFSVNCACPVCYDKPINICNVPCGHTCCEECHKKMKSLCPMCNMHIKESVKIYYSV